MSQGVPPAGIEAAEADGMPDQAAPTTEAPGRRRRIKRILLVTVLVLALLGTGGVVAGALYVRSVESSIERVEAFTDVPEESRPEKVVHEAKNLLILGSDSRDPENTSGSRTDTIILAHIPADRSTAQLISIPRDTWVHVPRSKDGRNGDADAKINAAFAWGGIPLMVQTVESFTGVRIDHVAVIDFAGFKEIVDALGGVDIDVEQNFTSVHPPYRTFRKGKRHMDGATALDYARQRYQFTDGDFARIKHQQQVIKAILDKAATGGLLTSPTKLNDFLRATADAVAVDDTLDIVGTAMDLRHLRGDSLAFYTSPSKGTGWVGDQSVVFADKTKATALFEAVRRDAVADIESAAK